MDLKMAKDHQQYLANHGSYTKIVKHPELPPGDDYILESCSNAEYKKDLLKYTFSVIRGGKSE